MSGLAGRGLDPPHHHMADGPARYPLVPAAVERGAARSAGSLPVQ